MSELQVGGVEATQRRNARNARVLAERREQAEFLRNLAYRINHDIALDVIDSEALSDIADKLDPPDRPRAEITIAPITPRENA